MKIEPGKLVVLKYELYAADGTLFETSDDDEPIEFVQGEGEVLPGLEREVEGSGVGDVLEFTLEAGDAFGDYNPEGLVSVPRADLPPDVELVKDDWITVEVQADDDEPRDEDEVGSMEMRIVECDDAEVVLDANHPLAGQAVRFMVEILAVRDAG